MADHRFEIPAVRHLGEFPFPSLFKEKNNQRNSNIPGMVVFRLKGENELTEKLLKRLNHRGNLHAVPASLKGIYVIRFTVTSTRTSNDDIIKDWSEIRAVATEILTECNVKIDKRVPLKGMNHHYRASHALSLYHSLQFTRCSFNYVLVKWISALHTRDQNQIEKLRSNLKIPARVESFSRNHIIIYFIDIEKKSDKICLSRYDIGGLLNLS